MFDMNQNYGAVTVDNKIIGKMCVYGCLKASITNFRYGDIVIVSSRSKQSDTEGRLNHHKQRRAQFGHTEGHGSFTSCPFS